MKIVMIGAGIIALTGLNTAIASHQFNQSAPSPATIQLAADQDNNGDTMSPSAPQNGTANPTDQNVNPETNQPQGDPNLASPLNRNPSTGTMQNNNSMPQAGQADQPPVPAPTAPAEPPVSNQPTQGDPNSQNSY